MPRVHIDVMLKDEILDPQGQAVERALPGLGFGGVTAVRIGKHVELDVAEGDDLHERITAIADKLLANPVIERFTYRVLPAHGAGETQAHAGERQPEQAPPSRRT